ncbi:MAG: S9 family peptidase [Saprospiraceae bacterium]
MRTPIRLLIRCSLLALLFAGCVSSETTQPPQATSQMYKIAQETPQPQATRTPFEMSMHGDVRTDNYYWMKLSDEQKNAEVSDSQTTAVVNYLETENAYTDKVMAHTDKFQADLLAEMRARIKEDDNSVPYRQRGYYYQTRYEEGKEYPIYARRKGSADAAEEIMLEVNELAEPFDYYAIGGMEVSQDNRYLAYGADTLSRRIYAIYIKDLETGEMLTDVIPNTTGGATWSNDGKYIFYTVKDATLRSYQVRRHEIGTSAAQDKVIFEEADPTFSVYVGKTKNDAYLLMASVQTLSTEYRILEADDPTGEFRVFQPRERDLEYNIDHDGKQFLVLTNLDARNFRLMTAPEGKTTKENWTELIGNRDDVLLEGMEVFQDFLVLSERKAGITQLRVRPDSGEEHYIDFPEDAYVAYTSSNAEFDSKVLRLGYQSLTTPPSTYDYDMVGRKLDLLKQQPVLGDFKADDYTSERVMMPARDGVEVPLSIVYKKGTPKDGTAPLLLYGYGSYGASMDPSFSSGRLSLLNRGFIYVIAHIRGGQEMGRQWYEDGKLLKKKNTFTDFIDAGDYLVKNNYTKNDRLFAMGGSAGGLLMGAVMNMRPEMWKGIIAAVPFVDVVSTMLDETIPLTTGEYDEWGNPNDKAYYDYIKTYSPYDNVTAREYPATLVTTGYFDSQVQYWEPAKWVAKLRELNTGKAPILLHTDMEVGHGGASGRFKRLKDTALMYAFILDLAGKADGEKAEM